MDLLLDSNGDLKIVDGDLVVTDSTQQAIKIAVQWATGEWRFNEALGVDYFGKVFLKDPNLNEITTMIRAAVLNVDGVTEIESCSLKLDSGTRKLRVSIVARCDSEKIESEVSVNV